MSVLKKILLSCSLLLAMNGAGAAELIINGGFEAAPAGTNTVLNGGSTAILGWKTINEGVEWFPASLLNANSKGYLDSNSVIDLAWFTSTGNPGGGIGQSFPTVPGKRYTLKFAATTQTGYGRDGTAEIQVLIDNKLLQKVSVANPKDFFGLDDWAVFTMTFTASNNETYLSFTNTQNANTHFALLDGVSVTPYGSCCPCGC